MLQVDIPKDDASFRRQFDGAASVYCLTPASEAVVRAWHARFAPDTPEIGAPDEADADDEELEEPF